MNDAPRSLSPEYFDAVRRAYPAILAGAKEARNAGYVVHPLRGKDAFLKGWPDLPNKEPLDIDQVFRSPKNECFNLGGVISADPQGDAPNIVIDVDLHGATDQKDRDDCMAKKHRLLGDLPPTTITGAGGEHYHFRAPAAFVAEIFAPGNAFCLEREGRAEGEPAAPPPGAPRPRWMIEALGPRHSITLPPSVHPDTLRPYRPGCESPRTRQAPYSLIAAMRAERAGTGGVHVWGPRGQLVAPLPPVAPFDPEALLPDALRDYCVDCATRKVCPVDYVATAVLAALGAVIGAGCVIRPKNHDNWDVAPNLWGAIVGEPGLFKKTVAMESAMAMLSPLIDAEMQRFEEATLNYAVAKKTYDMKVKAAEALLKAAAKAQLQSDGESGDEKIEAATETLRQLKEKAPKPPVERRFTTNDPTVEKIGEIIRDNAPHGLLYVRDELTGMLAQWERKDHKGERAFYLEGHQGTGSFNTERIGRGRVFIPVLNVSLFGGIQPDMLAALLEQNSGEIGRDGTVQRFQLLVYPERVEWEWTNQSPDLLAYDRASKVFKRLASFNPIEWGAAKGERDKFPWFTFDEKAQKVFIQWSHDLHTKRIPGEDNPLIQQHLAKYDKLFPALALLFHLVDRSEGRGGAFVSEIAALRAAEWCLYLESHARRCYALLGHNRFRSARLLAKKIERGELADLFTVREVLRRHWTGLNDAEAVAAALEWLEIENWVRVVRGPSGSAGGRPTVRYELHPELRRPKP
jgi:hypothetical protein